jgi:hypothetical protein
MSWSMLYNYAASMAKDQTQQPMKPANGEQAEGKNGVSTPNAVQQLSYKTPIRKRDSSDYDA